MRRVPRSAIALLPDALPWYIEGAGTEGRIVVICRSRVQADWSLGLVETGCQRSWHRPVIRTHPHVPRVSLDASGTIWSDFAQPGGPADQVGRRLLPGPDDTAAR